MGRHSEGKTPTIQALYPRHRSMARYVVAGATNTDLCEIFGMTPSMITKIIHAPCFEAEVDRLRERVDDEVVADIRADLAKLGPRAVEVLDEQLNYIGMPEQIKQRAAFDVLDRLGYGDKKPGAGGNRSLTLVKVDKIVQNTTKEDLQSDVLELVKLQEDAYGQE